MPIPIRLINDQFSSSRQDGSPKDDSSMFLVNLEALVGSAEGVGFPKASSMKVLAEATDEDAEILLDLFNTGTIVSEAEAVENKKYAVPKGFTNDKLLRLKAASLVHGDSQVVGFTAKAVRVIKTLVLAEQNVYTQQSVKKPYSLIMAENKAKSANHSTLAFQRTASVNVTAQANGEISPEYIPGANDPYIKSRRFVRTEGGSNKQYIVRMFRVNGRYVVIAWRGRISDRHLTMEKKGTFSSMAQAEAQFSAVERDRTRRSDPYRPATEVSHPSLLGVSPTEASSTEPASTGTSVPRSETSGSRSETGRRRPEDVIQAPAGRIMPVRVVADGGRLVLEMEGSEGRGNPLFSTWTQLQQYLTANGYGAEVFDRLLRDHELRRLRVTERPRRPAVQTPSPERMPEPVVEVPKATKREVPKKVKEVAELPVEQFVDKVLAEESAKRLEEMAAGMDFDPSAFD